jgi:repressor LexA
MSRGPSNTQDDHDEAAMSRADRAAAEHEDDAADQLTERQERVLHFIESQIKKNGYPPTIREIGRHLGIKSTNGVNDHLNALQRKGFIKRQDHKSRTLSVVRSATAHSDAESSPPPRTTGMQLLPAAVNDDLVEIPLLGRVAAGAPILAEENREDTVRVSSFFLGRGHKQEKIFALRVVGESMIDDGIYDGDFLFVKKQPSARPGEIVVAMIEGEATVKRFFPEGDRIRFQPANAAMEPIFVSKREFRQTDILGIVVGVYRRV